eukprot:Skav216220  [mRNA]  locus=scaffold238:349502:350698:+ [translate_table: standard]
MAALAPGSLMFVNYGEVPEVYHTRLVLDHVENLDYIIGTPDLDIYTETLDPSNPDYTDCVAALPGGLVPPGINPLSVYAFAPMTAAELSQLMAAGRAEGALERARRGVGAAAAGVVAGGVARGNEIWVLADYYDGKKLGDKVDPPLGHPVLGDFGLMSLGVGAEAKVVLIKRLKEEDVASFCEDRVQALRSVEASQGEDRAVADDVRTLEVRYGANGERLRTFRESIKEFQQVDFMDFPLAPRTALDYCRAIAAVSESAVAQHHMWVGAARIPEGDRSVFEDETLARILDAAITYDCLDISNLCSMELVCRRRQLIADAHAQSPGMPSYLAADHYMGQSYRAGGGIVTPSLTDHVSKQMAAQTAIMKEKRKMEEAKGGGKGKKSAPKATPKAGGGGGQ